MSDDVRKLALGRVLRDHREHAGLTLREASAKLGMSFSNLNAKEHGRISTKPPELREMAKLYKTTAEAIDDQVTKTCADRQVHPNADRQAEAVETLALAIERLALAVERRHAASAEGRSSAVR